MYSSSLISFSCMTKGFRLVHSAMENTRVLVLTLLLFALIKGYWCLDVTIFKKPVKIGDDVLFEINPPSVPQSGSWNSLTLLAFWVGPTVFSGFGYKGRVSVNTSTGSLTLKSVRLSDSGNYFVQGQTTDGVEFNGNTTLTVFEPVSQPTVRSNVTDPVEFNNTVSLTCTASGSAVSYRWFNGSSVVSDSERIRLSDDNKTLTIPRVLRSDDGTLYCYAFNPVSNSTSEAFHLIVSYGPDDMTINPPDPIYSAGSDLTLSCSAQSSPPAHYQWFFNGAPLNKLGSQLNMAHIQHNQTGNYTCWASNNITLRYGDVTRSITVIEPITNVTLNPTPAQPILNNTFNLTCEVSGLGVADSRLWMMDGHPLSTNDRITLSVDNSTVSFNPVLLSDNSTYQCTASNLVSNETGAGYKLIVNYGPEEASIMAPDLAVSGSAIMLTCSAHSQPPSHYTWYLNGKQTANGSQYMIDHVSTDNQGNYTCVAGNSVTGRNSSAIKELTVIDLITEVSVNHTPAQPILNDNLSLTCDVSGTVDSRHWLKDGQTLFTDDRITLSGKNSTVSFNPVLLTDNGTYQCTANNHFSNKTSDGYTLVVNYGPEQASITGPQLAAVGSSVTLTCSAPSQPPCGYTWYFNGTETAQGSHYKMSPVSSANSGPYTCVARNSVTGNNSSAVMELIVIGLITEVSVNHTPAHPILNDNLSLTCDVSGTVDSRHWLKDGQSLFTDDRVTLSGENSTVSFNPVLLTDNGTYQCTANNRLSNKTSDGYILVVNYGPEEASIMAPDLAVSGSAIMLTCSARSQPPSHYTWYLNGKQTANGSQYMIDPVSADNQGNYTCVAWNSVTGRNSSAIKELTVIELITEVSVNHTPAQPILSNNLSLTCDVSGTIDSRHWLKDGHPLTTDNRITLSGENSTVSFNPVLLTDNGTYQCTANNRLSNKTSDGYILVVNYGPEEASIMAPDLAANGSAIMLTCSARSQPPSHYTWYLNGKQTANGSQYMINHVSTDNQGNYTCVAWNSVTRRNSSAIKELTVIELITEVSVNHTHAQPILNDNLSLTCDVSGTVDSMHWLKDGQPLSTDDRITLSGKNSTVSFNPVLLTDKGTYQCIANNPFSNKTSDGYILFVNYGPEQASITGPQLAAVGSSVTLTCSAPSQPPCGYTWYFNGTETAQGSHYKMSPVSSDNSGPYTCVARNTVTGNSSSAVMELIVIAPISNINVKPTPAQPIENNTFSLTCNVTGTADSRLWWKDDQPLSTTERITLSGDNSTVSFNPVLQSDNGTYQCTASDPVSQLNSTGYRLDVNYGPEHVSISGPDSAVKGSTVTFTCSAHSQPSCQYMWYFKGKETAKGSQYKIFAVSTNNNGGYTCVAWNSVTGRNSSAVKDLVVTDPNGSASLASGHAVEVAIAVLVLLLCVSG